MADETHTPPRAGEGWGRRLEPMLEHFQDIIYCYQIHPKPGFDYVSAAVERITGYTPDEFYADPTLYWSIVHPDDRHHIEKLSSGSTPVDAPLLIRWRHKNGGTVWVETFNTPQYNGDGILVGIAGVSRDVTVRSEDVLRESEAKYHAIFENVSIGLIEWDINDLFIALEELGCRTDSAMRDYIGKHPEFAERAFRMFRIVEVNDLAVDLFEAGNKQDLIDNLPDLVLPEVLGGVESGLDALFGGQRSVLIEAEYRTMKGRTRQILASVSFPDRDSKRKTALTGLVDVTGKNLVEDALRRTRFAIDHAADALYWISPDGRLADVNDAACRHLGYTREELLQMHIWDIAPSARDWEPLWRNLKKTISTMKVTNHVAKDGRVLPVEIIGNYVNYHGEEYDCVFARDISERRHFEAQLRQAQRLETIGTLAGGIAHDFNNILGPILGYSDMMLQDLSPDSPLRPGVEQIWKAGSRAKKLVEQILLFGGRSEEAYKPVEIQHIIKETTRFLEASVPTTIRIVSNIDGYCPPVEADPTQIHQVLMNLCTNASHAMEETGGVLTISFLPYEPEADFITLHPDLAGQKLVRLTVADTGEGMDETVRDRIFEPFFTTKEVGKGTGLGLAVAHGIVLHHGGAIGVESDPGRGTSFHVYLPVAAGIG